MNSSEDSAGDEHDPQLAAAPLVIKCDTRSSAGWSWLFSALVAGLAGYSAYSMTRGSVNWSRDWPILACFVIVFPAIACLFILASAWATLLARKQGVTILRIPRGYVVEGEVLRGTIECARSLELLGPAKATLDCLELRSLPEEPDTKIVKRTAWSDEATLHPARRAVSTRDRSAADAGTQFVLEIRVPELRRTSQAAPTDRGVVSQAARIRWTLTVTAPLRGLDYEAHFDLPILSTSACADDR